MFGLLSQRWQVVKFFVTCANATANSSKFLADSGPVYPPRVRVEFKTSPCKNNHGALVHDFFANRPLKKTKFMWENRMMSWYHPLSSPPIFWVDRWGKTKLSAPNLSLHSAQVPKTFRLSNNVIEPPFVQSIWLRQRQGGRHGVYLGWFACLEVVEKQHSNPLWWWKSHADFMTLL